MQDLLSIALRVVKDNNLIDVICALSKYFKELCAKELTIEKLDEVRLNVVMTLCQIKKLFPSNFFAIKVHLIVQLIEEAMLPVLYRLMSPIRRLG